MALHRASTHFGNFPGGAGEDPGAGLIDGEVGI